jgi:LysM repeat protein
VWSRPTSYVVQRGDTLYRLALRFGVRTETLAVANGLAAPYNIQAGQVLTIPPQDSWVSVTLYVVKAGDSLYSIAQAWGLDWVDLATANGIPWPYQIYVGQELAIPVSQGAIPTQTTVLTTQTPTVTASPVYTITPTITPSPSPTPTEESVPTATPMAGWTIYNIHTGDFSLHHPSSWAITPDTVSVEPLGPVDRHAVAPVGSSGLVGNSGGVLVIGLQRNDSVSLLELWRDNIASLLPGSNQAASIDISWEPSEAFQLSGQPATRMLGTMTIQITGQPDSVMKIWLGAVVHGDLNYGLFFKATEGEWSATYMAVFQVMIETFTLK